MLLAILSILAGLVVLVLIGVDRLPITLRGVGVMLIVLPVMFWIIDRLP